MTIPTIKAGGWPANGSLASSELNSIQTALTRALDRTAAGDTLSGAIQLSGAGRIIPSVATGPNSNSTITVGSSNTVYKIDSTLTADRTYTLSSSGASTGDIIYFYAESSFNYKLTLVDSSAPTTTLFELGNADANDGPWVSFIYIGTWRVYQASQGSRLRSVPFISSGTWTCPRGVTRILMFGYGGGGAGGAGAAASWGAPYSCTGGSGGGGAIGYWVNATVVPGTTYTVTIGAGGVSGGQNHGQPTTLVTGGTTIASFPGAYGAYNGFYVQNANDAGKVPSPGLPVAFTNPNLLQGYVKTYLDNALSIPPGAGGTAGAPVDTTYNTSGITPRAGQANFGETGTLISGGSAGAQTSIYGGGGGGGGAGPGGAGGNGGAGATAQQVINGAAGSVSANSGAGGGGSGGSYGYTGAINLGGSGGSGKVTIYYVK